ncbi:MAG: Mor transcription activator family protein [Methylobacter sp.]
MNNLTQVLKTTIKTQLAASSFDDESSSTIAKNIINDLVSQHGGRMFYLPSGGSDRIAAKHRQILADFNGSNHADICRKHEIGAAWLKKLLKRNGVHDENVQ